MKGSVGTGNESGDWQNTKHRTSVESDSEPAQNTILKDILNCWLVEAKEDLDDATKTWNRDKRHGFGGSVRMERLRAVIDFLECKRGEVDEKG